MQKIILSGCCGHMGRVVADICAGDPEVEVSAGIDLLAQPMEGFPVFSSPAACAAPGDVLIDFSHPAALEGLLEFCAQRKLPAVLATTGYSEEQLAKIEAASGAVPIFRSANMSIGINVLLELVRQAAALLGDGFDVEITERHHRRKLDAPSGTALMLARQTTRRPPPCPTSRNTSMTATASASPGTAGRSVSPPSGGAPLWGTTPWYSRAGTR